MPREGGHPLDRPPEFIIGPAFGRTRWRAMTTDNRCLRKIRRTQYHRLIGPRCGVGGPILTNASSR